MTTSRLPQSVIFNRLATRLNRSRKARHLQHHSYNYCAFGGQLYITRAKGYNYDPFFDDYNSRCRICGAEYCKNYYMNSTYHPKVGKRVPRRVSIGTSLTTPLIMALVFVIVSGAVYMGERPFNRRLSQADKQHTYSVNEKALCNAYIHPEGIGYSRSWVDCKIITKTDVGGYQVEAKNVSGKGTRVTDIRALDMKPVKQK